MGRRLRVLVPLATVVVVVKNGVNLFAGLPYMEALAQHWTDPKASILFRSDADYLLSSPTSAVAAGVLHLTSVRAFLTFHLVLSIAALFSPLMLRKVRRSGALRTAVLLFIVGGPAAAVLLSWLGSYDPVSFGAGAVGALASSAVVAGGAWALFAFNNAPEALLALVAYGAVRLAGDGRAALPRLATSTAGALAGYVGIHVLTLHWGGSTSRFGKFHTYPFHDFVKSTTDFWPLIIFSSIGAGWFLFGHRAFLRQRSTKVFLSAVALFSLGIPFIALDQTRVVATTLWPGALLALSLGLARLSDRDAYSVLRRIALPALIVPVAVVWNDSVLLGGWNGLVHLVQGSP